MTEPQLATAATSNENLPILVVDDEQDILDFVRGTLESEGYEVLSASDGLEALEAVRRQQPALILLDMRMPNMTGRQFAEEYHRLSGPHAPIVIMTASIEAARLAVELQAETHLGKPFSLDDLIRVVRRCLPSGVH